MNKLVIVGNGFDLAHGLPTSYKHFVNDFWLNLKSNYENPRIKELVYVNSQYSGFLEMYVKIPSYGDFTKILEAYAREYGYVYNADQHDCFTNNSRTNPIFKFENEFFKQINVKNSIENWVDIENEYYQKLKNIVKTDRWDKSVKKRYVQKLNKEFDQVKNLLEKYLISNVEEASNLITSPDLNSGLLGFFEMDFIFQDDNSQNKRLANYIFEFKKEDVEYLAESFKSLKKYDSELLDGKMNYKDFEEYKKEILFINFNYTSSLKSYTRKINEFHYCKSREIQIHGEFNAPNNEVNFGFGDEMDEDYRFIEDLDENEYLRNFKSFKYSQNSNYKNLLDYIDSEKFQVYIMGHSCGLSDRTLLNTIFEHENCRSIKVFYHDRGDGSDNFTEIVQNISRHFNDKKVMREKIVNKSLCVPLPQDIRFQEKYS